MKRKSAKRSNYPETDETPESIREAAACYGVKREVMGIREAKDQFSSVVQRASLGEEIVITSDGKPAAMVVRYRRAIAGKPYVPNLEWLRSMPVTPDSTPGIRAERDGGY